MSNTQDTHFAYSDKKCWYVIQVHTSFEESVIKSLKEEIEKQGLSNYVDEFFSPALSNDNNATVKKKIQKIYPGYIFIKMQLNDSIFHLFRRGNRIMGFVGAHKNKPIPSPLSDSAYEDIISSIESIKNKKTEVNKDISVGTTVKITEGSFISLLGTVDFVDAEKQSLKVLIKIFDRETAIDLNVNQVEVIKD